MEKEDKASDFIERHITIAGDKRQINVVTAITELYARFKTSQEQIKELQEALGYFSELEERIKKLEGTKIEIVSPDQANIFLRG